MTARAKTLTVIVHYEPAEERQVAAILMVLRRAARRRGSELCRLQMASEDGSMDQHCEGNAADIEDAANDTRKTDPSSSIAQ
jgi:hypothetical protein